MIRLDFLTNFNREEVRGDSAKDRDFQAMAADRCSCCPILRPPYLCPFFSVRCVDEGMFSDKIARRENSSILIKAALILKKLYFEFRDSSFL